MIFLMTLCYYVRLTSLVLEIKSVIQGNSSLCSHYAYVERSEPILI